MHRLAPFAVLLASATAFAQEPRAPIKDDQQLAEELAAIANDPTVPVHDKARRDKAQGLMTEGVRLLLAGSYDQALANLLEAYASFPHPMILLNIASTLRDMGKPADAANTYQRYLSDPLTGPERVAEVKAVLAKLDGELTILTVRVAPRLSAISIDGGPWVTVGSSLVSRVRPGIHLVRIRRGDQIADVSVNGFEGETKEVLAALKNVVALDEPRPDPAKPPPPKVEEVHQAWMDTDYHYTRDETNANPNARGYRVTADSDPLPPTLLTQHDVDAQPPDLSHQDATADKIASGALAVMRIDGKGRGFAGGLGVAIARDHLEVEAMVLRSSVTGGYVGGRYRFLTGFFRPYAGLGIPFFVFDNPGDAGMSSLHFSPGVRGAGGLELVLDGHVSIQADLGVEHFFRVADTRFEANAFVPTLGIIGRL